MKLQTLNEIDFSQKENCQDTEVFRHCPLCRCCLIAAMINPSRYTGNHPINPTNISGKDKY